MIALNLPGKAPIEVKDRGVLKATLFDLADKIGGAEADTETKVKKLTQLFEVNEKSLNSIGPDLYLDVKNKINDVIRGLLA